MSLIPKAQYPVVLAGYGTVRANAAESQERFVDTFDLPVATTFMAKGVLSDRHPNVMGTIVLYNTQL
jgi:acetolactate synthase-1/2/3 large subunit